MTSKALTRKTNRQGQSVVEYMLAISVLVIAFAAGMALLAESTQKTFENARETVQQPWP